MEDSKRKMYILMLEIPSESLKLLSKRTEEFLNNLKNRDEITEDDEDDKVENRSGRISNFSICFFSFNNST